MDGTTAVQAVLTVSKVKDLEKLTTMADKLVETTRFARKFRRFRVLGAVYQACSPTL